MLLENTFFLVDSSAKIAGTLIVLTVIAVALDLIGKGLGWLKVSRWIVRPFQLTVIGLFLMDLGSLLKIMGSYYFEDHGILLSRYCFLI